MGVFIYKPSAYDPKIVILLFLSVHWGFWISQAIKSNYIFSAIILLWDVV